MQVIVFVWMAWIIDDNKNQVTKEKSHIRIRHIYNCKATKIEEHDGESKQNECVRKMETSVKMVKRKWIEREQCERNNERDGK